MKNEEKLSSLDEPANKDNLPPFWFLPDELKYPKRRPISHFKFFAKVHKRIEHTKKFFERIESARLSSINNAKSVPKNATIRKEHVTRGKPLCYRGEHGPYYYAYWKEGKKLKKKYIGTHLPKIGKD